MKRGGGLAAQAALGAATQPGGLRKIAAVLGVLVLLGVLILGGGIALLVWMGSRPPAALPCGSESPVTLAPGFGVAGSPPKRSWRPPGPSWRILDGRCA